MVRMSVMRVALLALVMTTGCGDDGPAGPSTATPRLMVSYSGFVGASFSASAPTFCPTVDCAVTPPQSVTAPGTYTYAVADGATYVIKGTLIGRPAPLGPPNADVAAALAFSLGWEPLEVVPLFGIRKSSVKVFVNDVLVPTAVALNSGCGRAMETLLTPGTTTRFTFIFSVTAYVTPPSDLCE